MPGPDVYWVVKGRLGVSPAPWTRKDVEKWLSKGIKSVVLLLNEEDSLMLIDWGSVEELARYLTDLGLEVIMYKLGGGEAPPLEDAIKLIESIDVSIERGLPTLLVCSRGWGRGGSLAAAYLTYKGLEPAQAVDMINELARVNGSGKGLNPGPQEELPYKVYHHSTRIRVKDIRTAKHDRTAKAGVAEPGQRREA